MKPKGINPLELHVEKIVIGFAVIIVALLGARQIFTQPNAVEIAGESKALAPAELDPYIARKAEQLETAMATSQTVEIPEIETLSDWFIDEHNRTRADNLRNPVSLNRATTFKIGGSEIIETGAQQYADFIPPAPENMRIHVRRYSIESREVELYPELAAQVGDQPPYDLPVVHVVGSVDGTRLKKLLETPQENKRTIPSVWWQDDMSILDVAIERQQLLSDGSWSETELVPHIPRDTDIRTRIDELRFSELDEFFSEIGRMGEDIYQIPFYRLYDGTDWSIKLLKADEPLTAEEEKVLSTYKKWKRKRIDAEKRLARYEISQERKKDSKRNTGESTSQTSEGGSPRGKGSSRNSSRDNPDKKSVRENLQEVINTAVQEEELARERVLDVMPDYEFEDMKKEEKKDSRSNRGRGYDEGGGGFGEGGGFEGGGFEGGGFEGGGKGRPSSRSKRSSAKGSGNRSRNEVASLLENEKLEVWAHDINIVPGNTYRYRLVVRFYNPFYGRSSRLDSGQKNLADKVIAPSMPTEWSESVRVSPPQQFYAVDGKTSNLVAERKATFEIYLFSGGQHRMTSLTIKPGDPIGEQKTVIKQDYGVDEDEDNTSDDRYATNDDPVQETVKIDFYTGAVLLDVLKTDTDQTGFGQGVEVVVCLEDGSVITLEPESQREDDQRKRLREAVAKSSN